MKLKQIIVNSSLYGESDDCKLTFVTNDYREAVKYKDMTGKEFFMLPVTNEIFMPRKLGRQIFLDYAQYMLAGGIDLAKDDYKVIFNPPATILWKNGKKYVSKAHDEEFDEEKGLLMCLAKANGISHLELKRMIKNAKRPEKKEKP